MERRWVWLLLVITPLLLYCCCHEALSQSDKELCLKQTCGDVSVSYPFKLAGMDKCPSFSPFFHLHCKQDNQLYLTNMTHNNASVDMRILHLDTNSLIVDATNFTSSPLTPSPNGSTCVFATNISSLIFPAAPSPFFISGENRFGSFGCSMGILVGVEVLQNASDLPKVELGGCSVLCPGGKNNPDCEGHACCVVDLDRERYFRELAYAVEQSPFIDITSFNASKDCQTMYAVVFHPDHVDFSRQTYGMKLGWALPYSNQTQSISDLKKTSDFACSNNSNTTMLQEVHGYYCSCPQGFHGDGYSQRLGLAGCAVSSFA